MELREKFTDRQLTMIRDEALKYLCACPAQVAEQIRALRRLYAYQSGCIDRKIDQYGVHTRIVEAIRVVHPELERCLDEILTREGWDRGTLKMPPGLRMVRDMETAR